MSIYFFHLVTPSFVIFVFIVVVVLVPIYISFVLVVPEIHVPFTILVFVRRVRTVVRV